MSYLALICVNEISNDKKYHTFQFFQSSDDAKIISFEYCDDIPTYDHNSGKVSYLHQGELITKNKMIMKDLELSYDYEILSYVSLEDLMNSLKYFFQKYDINFGEIGPINLCNPNLSTNWNGKFNKNIIITSLGICDTHLNILDKFEWIQKLTIKFSSINALLEFQFPSHLKHLQDLKITMDYSKNYNHTLLFDKTFNIPVNLKRIMLPSLMWNTFTLNLSNKNSNCKIYFDWDKIQDFPLYRGKNMFDNLNNIIKFNLYSETNENNIYDQLDEYVLQNYDIHVRWSGADYACFNLNSIAPSYYLELVQKHFHKRPVTHHEISSDQFKYLNERIEKLEQSIHNILKLMNH